MNTHNNSLKGHLVLWGTSPLWGSTFIAGEIAVKNMPASEHALLRIMMASVLFAVYLGYRRLKGGARAQASFWKFGIIGFLSTAIFAVFHAWQIELSNATQTAILVGLLPVSLSFAGVFFLKEKYTLYKAIGMTLAVAGMVIVTNPNTSELTSWSRPWQLLGASIGTAFGYCAGIVLIKNWKLYEDPIELTGWTTIFGTLSFLPLAFLFGIVPPDFFARIVTYNEAALVTTFYLGLLGNVVAFSLYVYALKFVPAGDTGMFIFVEPLWAALFSYLLFGRLIENTTLGGGLLLFFGVALALYHGHFQNWLKKRLST